MARLNTPTDNSADNSADNSVAERYMRTFKEHKVDGITIEEKLSSLSSIHTEAILTYTSKV